MDRVLVYETNDRGSTPLGHTKKMRTANLQFDKVDQKGCILALIIYWGMVELVNTTVRKGFC